MCDGRGQLIIRTRNAGTCTLCHGSGSITTDPRPSQYAVYWAGYKAGADAAGESWREAVERLMKRLEGKQ